ncbi:MAG: O-antigen ligase family protein [Blastocatellia bacterium]
MTDLSHHSSPHLPIAASPRRSSSASPRRRVAASLASIVSLVSVEGLLIFWFIASPVASFYLRFPLDKSLVTFNRGVIALAVFLVIAKAWTQPAQAGLKSRTVFTATKFEIAWAAVAAIALVNATFLANDFTYALRLAVDTFGLPLLVFHLARYHFDARGRSGALLLAAAALAWCLFATGAYEFLTGTNLFPYKGSELVREGERRVNGPFAADSSFAIICLFVFVLLQAAPALFRLRMDRAARFFTTGALIAAAAAVLLPMFRSAAIALVACWLIVRVAAKRIAASPHRPIAPSPHRRVFSRRVAVSPRRSFRISASVIALMMLAVIGIAAVGLLSSNKRLTNPRNVIGRLATWESAAAITADHPLFGVGLSNYQWAFDQRYFWSDQEADELLETAAADSPHSNLLWVAAEMGVFAFLFYVVANAYLLLLGWRAWRRATTRSAKVAAAAFIALFVAYWLPGLTLASGYYSDTNLYFFFLVGLLSNESLVSGS